ncbi:MAG: hypothetical protein IKL08_04560 [Clostridia bacterium]|nr:hypothetical protein [Clostridia bacterium]
MSDDVHTSEPDIFDVVTVIVSVAVVPASIVLDIVVLLNVIVGVAVVPVTVTLNVSLALPYVVITVE